MRIKAVDGRQHLLVGYLTHPSVSFFSFSHSKLPLGDNVTAYSCCDPGDPADPACVRAWVSVYSLVCYEKHIPEVLFCVILVLLPLPLLFPGTTPSRRCLGRNLNLSTKFISSGVFVAAPASKVSRTLIGSFKTKRKVAHLHWWCCNIISVRNYYVGSFEMYIVVSAGTVGLSSLGCWSNSSNRKSVKMSWMIS